MEEAGRQTHKERLLMGGVEVKPSIFISIPRTGTRSLRQTLHIRDPYNHRTAVWVRNKIGPQAWADAFTYAFIRNPFDKLISWYFYHKVPGHCPKGVKIYVLRNFNEWVLNGCQHHWTPMGTFGTKGGVPDPHSLSGYLFDERGKIMVDFVGRVEHMQRDYAKLCKLLGKKNPPALKHVNCSAHSNRRQIFSDEARKYVERRFARDLKMWGYEF
jgi:hypothetical protein